MAKINKFKYYQAHESNYTKGRGGKTIKYFTVHHTAGNESTLRYLWGNPNRNASSHFYAGDNHSEQYVDTDDTAWTNSNWTSNQESITCETRGDWRNGYKDTSTLVQLCEIMYECLKLYPNLNINYHMDVSRSGTLCPADLKHKGYALEQWNKAKNRIRVEKEALKQNELKTDIKDKKVILIRDANLWDMNFTTWSGARAIKALPKGTVIDVAGIYNHKLGGKYYLSNYSWNKGLNNGINIKDCADYVAPKPAPEPKPTPKPAPEPTPEPVKDESAGTLPPISVDPNGEKINEILQIVRWIKNFLAGDVDNKLGKIINYLRILPAWLGKFAKNIRK